MREEGRWWLIQLKWAESSFIERPKKKREYRKREMRISLRIFLVVCAHIPHG